jgi:polyphenol oxidase
MNRLNINGLNLWKFDNLSREAEVEHYVSDRDAANDGVPFTLSLSSSPDKELVRRNRARIATAMGIEPSELYFPSQIHETRIVHVTKGMDKSILKDTDALICSERALCISVMSADCVPILLYDKRNKAVAAVHSGWRGTVAKILTKTLDAMSETFGTKGEDIIAGIGPSVSQENYEVGEEVVGEVTRAFDRHHELLIPQPPNKAKLDLWRANELQLIEFGVRPQSIEISDLCTIKNNHHFFSARKGDAGRFAAGILLRA